MTFSQFAGTAIVPTLSRIVLAVVFIAAGADKLFRSGVFTAAEAERLRALGVTVEPIEPVSQGPLAAPAIVLAAYRQDDPQGSPLPADEKKDDQRPPEEDRGEIVVPPAEQPARTTDTVTDTVTVTDTALYRAENWHHVTLLADGAGVPQARFAGLAAGVTEILGGIFMLTGFMARLWGFAIAVVMGVAFWLVSIRIAGVHTMSPFEFVQEQGRFNGAATQVALLVLALGVCLTGAGPASLDRLLFRRGERRPPSADGTT
jgi:uncharacterized membrane protein YphA (DoxX/SURF4 family)